MATSIKLNKKEFVYVEGTNWKVGVEIETEDFDGNVENLLIESATRAITAAYITDRKNFEIGSYVLVVLRKKVPHTRYVNSYTALSNASFYKLSEDVRESVLKSQNIDLSKVEAIV